MFALLPVRGLDVVRSLFVHSSHACGRRERRRRCSRRWTTTAWTYEETSTKPSRMRPPRGRVRGPVYSIKECFYDNPPPMPATVSKPIPRHSFLLLLLVRPLHENVIVNTSLSRIFFFDLAACNGKYSLFSGSCNGWFGGGAIVETLKSSMYVSVWD